jgi:hypothetical protein
MTYDNTKLNAAFARWIDECCVLTFGGTYSGDLLDNFDNFCAETSMLKRSPGRVAFGRELAGLDLEKYKYTGLTYWAGIKLKNPPVMSRYRRHAATIASMEAAHEERQAIQKAKQAEFDRQQAEHNARVKERMKAETKMWERIRRGDYPWED